MRILFDQGVPRGITASFRGHEVTEARKLKWERVSNGELLKLAESAGFELMLTTDKNVRFVRQHLDEILAAVNAAIPGSYAEVEIPFV